MKKFRSPDGTCIMTCSDDGKIRLFDTNADMLNLDNKEPKEIVKDFFNWL